MKYLSCMFRQSIDFGGLGLWCLTPFSTVFQIKSGHSILIDRDRMVIGFTTVYAIGAYHH
jgi:hypothetical protein